MQVGRAVETIDGSGARMKRLFPTPDFRHLDPFVFLDEFAVESPAGFPEHHHSGFEIITYMVEGAFRHNDSLGNETLVPAGGLQRITVGRGIMHSGMPGTPGVNRGLQLWVLLPRGQKYLPPEYQQVEPGALPEQEAGGVRMRAVVGDGSPVRLHTAVVYLDISMNPRVSWSREVPRNYNGFIYVLGGLVRVGDVPLRPGDIAVFGPGAPILATSTDAPARFVFIAGRPHGEPIWMQGPFVE